jgi:hypothetical protein
MRKFCLSARTGWVALIALSLSLGGCITASVVLATAVVGQSIKDADIKKRGRELAGKGPDAADAALGPRLETLVDARRAGRELLIYSVKDAEPGTAFYVADVEGGKIVALAKQVRDDKAVQETVSETGLDKKLLGKSPSECEREAKLGTPVLVLRSREKGESVRVYDPLERKLLGGAPHCVLRFDTENRCMRINLIGLHSATKKGGVVTAADEQ